MRRLGRSYGLLAALGFTLSRPTHPPNYPTGTIELKYYAQGHWAVTAVAGGACCDSSGNKFEMLFETKNWEYVGSNIP